MKTTFLLALALLCGGMLHAQLSSWTYRQPVYASDASGTTLTNYQVQFTINTATLIAAGHMQATGDDIRFGDSCSTTIYDHWVESGINTATTVIWVRVPSIPANSSASFFMYYGNPSASSTSSFSAVFPNTLITGGPNVTLNGVQNYDWIQVDAGDTLFTTAGGVLTLNARNVIINGVISGDGRGYQAPAINTAGTGPGGGGTSTNSGSGGGSYGGVGGTGGLDAGDTPGTGGPANGTAAGTDLDMGSSGGSGTTAGASGGGAVIINADYITVSGEIRMNGGTAVSNASTSRGGGGGAGGGVMLNGFNVSIFGSIFANGSNGAAGTSTANDSGGGGGGGRVKVFTTGTLTNTGTVTANFGNGGPYGTQAPGQPGAVGTTSFNAGTFLIPSTSVGGEFLLPAAPTYTLSDLDNTICSSDVIVMTASTGFSTYSFLVNGSPVSTSSSNVYTFAGLSNGDVISVAGIVAPCFAATATGTAINVNPSPVAGTLSSDSVVCEGSFVTLQASGSAGTVIWYEYDGTNYISLGTGSTLMNGPMTVAGTYSFTVVASGTGCPDDTAAMLTSTIVNAMANAGTATSTLSGTDLCANDTIIFSTAGSNGAIDWYVQFDGVGPFNPFGSGNPFNPGPPSNSDTGMYVFMAIATVPGCPFDSSNTLLVNVRPTPVVALGSDTTMCGGSLLLDAGNPGESYLWNTTDITQTITATTSGVYIATVSTVYGCSSSDTIDVTINVLPVVDLGTDTTVCGQVMLDAGNPGDTYMWSNSATTQTITVTASGTYDVTVSSGPGCVDSDTITVTVNAPPTVAASGPTTICLSDAPAALVGTPAGGTFSGPGVTGSMFNPSAAGTGSHMITYTFVDVNGCSNTASFQVAVSPCVSVAEQELATGVLVYPNPSSGVFMISVNANVGDLMIEVTDLGGRTIYSSSESNVNAGFTKQVNLEGAAAGMYLLKLTSGSQQKVERITVQ